MGAKRGTAVERFWPKVDKRGPDECWLWTASIGNDGYGRLMVKPVPGRPVKAHRLAWEIAYGDIPDGLFVCHRCDNRRCCNPAHLFLGTAADNARDMASKGRSAIGARNAMVVLTDEQIRSVAERYRNGGISQRDLGVEFGVSHSTVSRIVSGVHWATKESHRGR